MKAKLECYPCFLNQALKTARMVTSDEKKTKEILDEVSTFLPKIPFRVTPPEIGREVYKLISTLSGIQDPYRKIKRRYIREALSLYPDLQKLISASEDRLLAAVKLAIAGNVIDFGANTEFDLKKDLKKAFSQPLAINHYQSFRRALAKAKRILYIADNAGETVFDRLLIEELDKPVIYAVRGRPIINDATQEDAVLSGIDKVAEIVSSGCDAPGTILKFCSKEFLEIYRSSDLIISKGQGNYETLSEEWRPIFFLLKTKCSVIAQNFGLKIGDTIFMESKRRA
jgi:uncharacterized protein with ATP-grasp and redox domains